MRIDIFLKHWFDENLQPFRITKYSYCYIIFTIVILRLYICIRKISRRRAEGELKSKNG